MTRMPRWIILCIAVMALLVCTSARPLQQRTPDGGLFFPETQKSINGEFLQFFLKTDKNTLIFGLPISDPMVNPSNPETQVQYFQRVRMELDTTQPVGNRVSLTPLGKWMLKAREGEQHQLANIDKSNTACRYFSKTGHSVCYAFLQYYNANNGAVYFGEPISEVEMVDGRLVQYFDNVRLEWRAEFPIGMRVTQTDLGTLYYPGQTTLSPSLRDPNNIGNINTQAELTVRVFPAKPLLGVNDTQTIYVVVQTSGYAPVAHAAVMLNVQTSDGKTSLYRLAETNAQGFSLQENIPIPGFKPNSLVSVTVEVMASGNVTARGTTWFRVWW